MHFGVSRGDNQRPCAAGRPKFPARATWFRAIGRSPERCQPGAVQEERVAYETTTRSIDESSGPPKEPHPFNFLVLGKTEKDAVVRAGNSDPRREQSSSSLTANTRPLVSISRHLQRGNVSVCGVTTN